MFLFFFCQLLSAAAAGGPDPAADSTETVATACVFDVGQGSCFFFVTHDRETAILIDAGSSIGSFEDVPSMTPKVDLLSEIPRQVRGKLGQTTRLLVIVTHPDNDHINLLKDVIQIILDHNPDFAAARSPIPTHKSVKIILGGRVEDYKSLLLTSAQCKAFDLLQDSQDQSNLLLPGLLEFNKQFCCDITFTGGSNILENLPPCIVSSSDIANFLNNTQINVEIIQAPTVARDNTWSIVTRIEYCGKSFMITGDAENLDQLAKNKVAHSSDTDDDSSSESDLPTPNLESTVLLASHHGAVTARSNHPWWFNTVKPKCVVFSHGLSPQYLHPQFKPVNRACRVCREVSEAPLFRDLSLHAIFHAVSDPPNLEGTFAGCLYKGRSMYQLILTDLPIFSTHMQGNIIFTISAGGNMNVVWDKHPSFEGRSTNEQVKNIIESYCIGIEHRKTKERERKVTGRAKDWEIQMLSVPSTEDAAGSPLSVMESLDQIIQRWLRHYQTSTS